jgi:hypothetical protein
MTTFRCNLRKANGLFALAVCALGAPAALAAEGIVVPSGQPVSFIEFISEEATNTVRFRFLTPEIGKSFQYADVAGDFQVVCDEQVVPALEANGLTPAQIVLSMSAVDIPFGEPAPEVLQFFEIFRAENGTCIWEEF